MRAMKSTAAIGVGAILVLSAGTAVAANGHSLLIGKTNKATKTTILSDKKGTPLSLVGPARKPPLQVSSSTLVRHLNAAEVGGLSAEKLQRRITGKCSKGHAATAVTASGGLTCAAVAAPQTHVVELSADGSDTANGTALLNVISAIGTPSASSGWVVLLGPGTFDLGQLAVTAQPYVDIVGSGVDVTTLMASDTGCTGGGTPALTNASVELAAHSTLSRLTVANHNTDGTCIPSAVRSFDPSGPAFVDDVAADVSGFKAVGAMADLGSNLIVHDFRVAATENGGDPADYAEGARADRGATLTVTDSVFDLASDTHKYSVGVNEGSTVHVAETEMPSGATFNDGDAGNSIACIDNYTANFTAATC